MFSSVWNPYVFAYASSIEIIHSIGWAYKYDAFELLQARENEWGKKRIQTIIMIMMLFCPKGERCPPALGYGLQSVFKWFWQWDVLVNIVEKVPIEPCVPLFLHSSYLFFSSSNLSRTILKLDGGYWHSYQIQLSRVCMETIYSHISVIILPSRRYSCTHEQILKHSSLSIHDFINTI